MTGNEIGNITDRGALLDFRNCGSEDCGTRRRRRRGRGSTGAGGDGARQSQEYEGSVQGSSRSESNRSRRASLKDSARKPKEKIYPDHWSPVEVKDGLRKGRCLSGKFHVNKNKISQGFVRVEKLAVDIFVDGMVRQNRSIDGDQVIVLLDPVPEWNHINAARTDGNDDRTCRANAHGVDNFDTRFEDNESECALDEGLLRKSLEPEFPLMESLSLEPKIDSEASADNTAHGVDIVRKVAEAKSLQPTGKVVAIDRTNPNHKRDRVVGLLVSSALTPCSTPKRKLLEQAILSPLGSPPKYEQESFRSCGRTLPSNHYWLVPSNPRLPKLFASRSEVENLVCSDNEFDSCHVKDYAYQESPLREAIGSPGSRERILTGDSLVSAAIGEWDSFSRFPKAIISEAIGDAGSIAAETRAIMFECGLEDTDFSDKAYSCLPQTAWSPSTDSMGTGDSLFSKLPRKDLSNLRIFTIDPPTARDLDDALHVNKLSESRYEVGVHIADVSHFLRPGTALDEEAEARATSVYLVQRVIPMLPRLLCEKLCSLNPGVSRFAVSVIWQMEVRENERGDKRLDICSEWVGKSIIHSRAKLSYSFVQKIIEGCPQESWNCEDVPQLYAEESWSNIIDDIHALHYLAQLRRTERFQTGSIRLDNIKIVFERDEDGIPTNAFPYVTAEANQLIEEFMLLANMSIARIISDSFPSHALLRRHEEPDEKILKKTIARLKEYGVVIGGESSTNFYSSLEYLKSSVDDTALAAVVTQQLTKPMQLALYFCTGQYKDTQQWRHYALNSDLYTHFTSPIRRFPDVIVHRLLCGVLEYHGGFVRLPSQETGAIDSRHMFGVYKNSLRLHPISDEHTEMLLQRIGLPIDVDEIQEKALHCNERKSAAKAAQQSSDRLFLALYLAYHPVAVDSLCVDFGDRYLSLFVPVFGEEVKLYFDAVLANSLNPAVDNVHKAVDIDWRDRRNGDAILHDAKVNPKPEKVLDGVKKQCFPLRIAKLSHVPILLLGRCGNGCPPSVECTFYV